MMRLHCIAQTLCALLLMYVICPVDGLGKDKLTKDIAPEPESVLVTFPSEPCGDSAFVTWTAPPKEFLVESYLVTCEASDLTDRLAQIVDGGITQVVIGPLELNSTYKCFVSSRTKFHGTSKPASSEPFSTTTFCPSPPQNVEATFPSENCGDSVLVTWDASRIGEVEYYQIICNGDGVPPAESIVNGSVTEAVIGPLDTSNIEYTCSVFAVNSFGSSKAGVSNPFITGECPSPPRNVVASFFSEPPECSNNANVTWGPSLSGNVDSYFVQCVSDMDSFNVTVPGDETSVLFGNLSSPLVEYNCSVQASNVAGTSESALAEPFLTTSCPPIFVTLSVQLEISGYDSPDDFTEADRERVCLNALTLAGLTEEEATCEVIAVLPGSVLVFLEITTTESNVQQIEILAVALESEDPEVLNQLVQDLSGEGVQAVVLSVEVGESDAESSDFTVPSAVRNVQVETTAADCTTTATVSWQQPDSDGGATISKYVIFCSSDTASSPPGVIVGASNILTANVGPFQPGTFTCTVKAVNAAGSNAGTLSAPFTVVACPGAPTNVQAEFPAVSCGDNTRVTWVAPTSGGSVAQYFVSCASSAGTTTATVGGQVFSATVGPLVTSGVQYTCSVIARNEAGGSTASSAAPFTTGKCPGIPQSVATDLLKSTPTSWAATWTDGTAGIPQETYALKCVPRGSTGGCNAPYDTVNIVRGVQEGQISGLQSNTEYDCYVIAINTFGSRCSQKVEYKTFKCACDLSSGTNNFASGFTTAQSINLQPGGNQASINNYDGYYPYWTTQDNFIETISKCSTNANLCWDEEMTSDGTETVWRVSNAVTNGGFSAQPYSPALQNAAGESNAYTWNNRGTNGASPSLQPANQQDMAASSCFCAGFDFRSVTGAAQAGLFIQPSAAAKQADSRNSYLRIFDSGSGFDLSVIQVVADEFVETILPLGLDYTSWHRVTMLVEFVDGVIQNQNGTYTGNDIVKIFVGNTPVFQGTSWEAFWYGIDVFGSPRVQAVNSLAFNLRGTAAPSLDGDGFYIKSVALSNGI